MGKPKIRFKGYTDEWEQRKLGELVSFSKGSGYSKSDLKEVGTPIILYGRLYTKYQTVISEVDTFVDEKTGSVYSKGGEVIVPGSGETAEDISIASVIEKPGILLGGDLNVITPPANIDSAFLAISISNGKPHSDMAKMAQGKSVVHLHNSDLAKIDFPYPNYEEQYRISGYFSNLDHLITLHQRKYEQAKTLKKYMLQKMFPQDGMRVPEIRFAGFTDEWEQRKLGEVIEDYVEKTTVENQYPVLTSSQQMGIVLQDDYFSGDRVSQSGNIGYFVIPRGYFAYRSRSDNEVFVFNRNDCIDKGSISYFYPVFKPSGVDSDFLLRRLNYGLETQLKIASEGTGQHVLSLKKFKNMTALFPSINEQRKIGEYFTRLDHLITLHQRKCDELRKIKKYMLQNMFC